MYVYIYIYIYILESSAALRAALILQVDIQTKVLHFQE